MINSIMDEIIKFACAVECISNGEITEITLNEKAWMKFKTEAMERTQYDFNVPIGVGNDPITFSPSGYSIIIKPIERHL